MANTVISRLSIFLLQFGAHFRVNSIMFRVKKIDPSSGESEEKVSFSRNRTVAEFREYICKEWKIPTEQQKLYYQGKELIDEHKLMEYNIQKNHTVQLLVRPKKIVALKESSLELSVAQRHNEVELIKSESKFYRVGDPIDFKLGAEYGWDGAWFEAEIVEILADPSKPHCERETNIIFMCFVLRYYYMAPFKGKFDDIRPRSFHICKNTELSVGMKVLANVNIDEINKKGLWYDFEIEKIDEKSIEGVTNISEISIHISLNADTEFMRIETAKLLSERSEDLPLPPLRFYPSDCESCQDNKEKDCGKCGCNICAKKDHPERLLICDECSLFFHIECLSPPLESIPDEEQWYCEDCKHDQTEIVRAGESLGISSKQSNIPSVVEETSIEWDNEMGYVGGTEEFNRVPKDHFGPIPGIEVGTLWKFRYLVAEAGVHRPLVAGIHGNEEQGAYSIILSGDYEADFDNGEEFQYTGSGGRNLTGNKRVSGQSSDQELISVNLALAINCNAELNETGAISEDWRDGKPIRVVRKSGKSKYAPDEGFRYDGLYKVVKYFPAEGKSGFKVWKYLLRRDDPTPPPWGKDVPFFDIIYPTNYDAIEAKKREKKAEKDMMKKRLAELSKKYKKWSGTQDLVCQKVTKKVKIETEFKLNVE